jgi:hypothetical protein
MMKKFALSVALGAGIMWLADPENGAQRRRRARRRFAPVIDAAEKLPEHLPDHLPGPLHHLSDTWTATWSVLKRKRGDGMPSMDLTPDPTTISEFVDLARANGVHGGMDISDSKIVCTSCGAPSDAERMERLWLHRFEGATNPDDMSTVSALRCPVCSSVGLLITGYGPNASPEESDVIVRLQQPQDSGMAPFMSRT